MSVRTRQQLIDAVVEVLAPDRPRVDVPGRRLVLPNLHAAIVERGRADAARQQVGAAAADEQDSVVARTRVLEKRVELRLVRFGGFEHQRVARIDVGEWQPEHVGVRSGVSRFDEDEIAVAELPGQRLERGNDARVFDVRHHRRRGRQVVADRGARETWRRPRPAAIGAVLAVRRTCRPPRRR